MGKQNVVNNFCISVQSNERRCTSCHIGYGWKDNTFDFTSEEAVDCLVCHDTTGTYKKFPPGAGHPVYEETEFGGVAWEPPDLRTIAQNVGPTSRATCGGCHFEGGGGDAVKHGTLDSTLLTPDRSLDVHMASGEGELNFSCSTCHNAVVHDIPGSRLRMSVAGDQVSLPYVEYERTSCTACHGDVPHEAEELNQHAERVACQTCHVPTIAREKPTKVYWDWSKAGELNDDGSSISRYDDDGNMVYYSGKGAFEWDMDFIPEYVWFNGLMSQVTIHDKIDDAQVVQINHPLGSIDEPNSRIYPMKVHRGFQPYDPVKKTMVVPHLMTYNSEDTTAYWKYFDWALAITEGMDYAGLEYSGEYDFVETIMYWPATHMVAPAEDAVQCRECHGREGGRLDFAALGYSEERIAELTWEEDEYPAITEDELDQLVSEPKQGLGWLNWLIGVGVVFAIFEVTVTRHLKKEERTDS